MRLYRALLHLYPSSFRVEYGAEMCAIFAQRRRNASGAFAVAMLWLGAIGDTVHNAARVHWDLLTNDVRYAVRTLNRARGFAVTAILVAALGIGATTAAFSIADHVLLRALPFPEPERLVKLWQDQLFRGFPRMELSPSNYLDWKRLSQSFDSMAAYTARSANLIGQGDPERLDGVAANADLFNVLRVQAAFGRTLATPDGLNNAPRVVVLSDGVWRAKFGGDPNILGRSVVLDETPHVVVGVMAAGFGFPSRDTEFWTPLIFSEGDLEDRTNTHLQVVARLKPGVSIKQARSELKVIAAQLERAFPKENAQTGATVHYLRDQVSQQARTLLMALVGASICMLLIACTNLANLLLARALVRQKELAVRAALGAGWERLTRQMLTESLVLTAAGGIIGVLLAVAATPLLSRLVPNTMPIADVPGVDLRMLAVAALVTIGTGIGFSLLPALRLTRTADPSALREGTRTGSSRSTERLRASLVIAEVAASVVLLVASGLLVRALWRVQQIEPGFRTENVLTLRTSLPLPKYTATARRQEFYDRVLADLRALPGVSNAAYISFLPMVMRGGIWPVALDGRELDPAGTQSVSLRYVTPGFFDTTGVPLLRGRDVSDGDLATSPWVAVVSESFARQSWPGQDPIGRRFLVAFRERIVVGVAGNIRVRGLERESEPQVYVPSRQVDDGALLFYAPKDLVVSSAVPAATLIPAIRQAIARADPQQPVSDVRMLSDIVMSETAPRRAQVRVLTGFAAIAFLLAGIGVHGLLSFAVSSRRREIGLRIALGARSGEIIMMVMRRGVLLSAAGVVIGMGAGLAAGRALSAVLAGVSPTDPQTFGGAIALVTLMTLAGCLLPALRAVRVDPMTAIRAE